MEWIATAALVVMAGCAVWFTRAFIEFINRPPRIINTNMVLNPQIVDLLTNFRRRKPSAKRDVKGNMHSANNPLGSTESL